MTGKHPREIHIDLRRDFALQNAHFPNCVPARFKRSTAIISDLRSGPRKRSTGIVCSFPMAISFIKGDQLIGIHYTMQPSGSADMVRLRPLPYVRAHADRGHEQ